MILDNISTNCERTLKILLQEFCRGYIIIEKKLFYQILPFRVVQDYDI